MKFDKLDNAKLLSIILGSRADVINEAMAPYNTVGEMINHFTEEDILNTKGLGQATINKLNALSELYDRIIQEDVIKNMKTVSFPSEVYNLIKSRYKYQQQEILTLLTLDTKNHVTHVIDVFKGSLNSAVTHPREIFNLAIKYSAASIIIVHNHPSGAVDPSKEDIKVSQRLKEAGNIIGIKLIDSLIIGEDNYTSLKDKGII